MAYFFYEIVSSPSDIEQGIRLLLVLAAFSVIFVVAEIWRWLLHPPPEWTRKWVHVSCGCIIASFHWIFTNNWPVIILGFAVIMIMATSRTLKTLSSIYSISRSSYGDFYYIIAAVVLFCLSHEHPTYYFISILTLAISDALAAVSGSTFQRVPYVIEHHQKTVEGSMSFFLSTFLIVQIPLLLLNGKDALHATLIAIQISLIVTCLEAITLNGLDNVLVPFATYYLLLHYENLSFSIASRLFLGEASLLLLIAFISQKIHFLSIRGGVTLFLFLFTAYTLGDGLAWLVPPFMAIALIFGALTYRDPKHTKGKREIGQVVTLFYLTLTPTLLLLCNALAINFSWNETIANARPTFFPLFVGAVAAQTAISLFRMVYIPESKNRTVSLQILMMVLISMSLILPLSLCFHAVNHSWQQILFALIVAMLGPAFYLIVHKRCSNKEKQLVRPLSSLPFPWELRLQMLCNLLGVLAALCLIQNST